MTAFVSEIVLCIVIVSQVQNIREINPWSETRWIDLAGHMSLLAFAIYLLGKLP